MITVFGSLNVDFVMQVARLPQPGETVLGGRYFLVQGGKGANQACAAARAGGKVAMAGMVGRDDWGDFALALLREAGADLTAVGRSGTGTACASILVDAAAENAIAVASGANLDARATQVADEQLGAGNLLVLQMEVSLPQNWILLERTKTLGARVLLNLAPAAPIPETALDLVDILVVNEIEAAMLDESLGLVGSEADSLADVLASRSGLTTITTLGRQGAVARGPQGAWSVAAVPVTAVDTTGAGDAFVGCLAAALDEGQAMPEALRFASVGAGLCCTIAGAQSSLAWREQIEARLSDLPPAKEIS